MAHGLLRNGRFGYWLNDLVVYQQAVNIFDLFIRRVRRLKFYDTTTLAVFNTFGYRFLYQFLFILEFFHSHLPVVGLFLSLPENSVPALNLPVYRDNLRRSPFF